MTNEIQTLLPCYNLAAESTRNILIKLGILPNKACHDYLILAMQIMLQAGGRMSVNRIYEAIEEKTGVNKLAVASSIYRGVKEAGTRSGYKPLYSALDTSGNGYLTSSEFISMLYIYVKKKLAH